jgi:hypothetical protein
VTFISSSQASGSPKDEEAEKGEVLAKILELGQGDIEARNFRDIKESSLLT